MSLKIVVLAKQVPDTRNVGKDAMTAEGTVNRAALPAIFNPEDLNALEQALRLKDQHPGSTVTVLTMGLPKAADVLRESLYRGADAGVLLTDRALGGADTLATSYALSQAIKKIGMPDIIVGGRQAIDGDTAQVGPQVAQKLGLDQVTYVESVVDGKVTLVRRIDGGVEKVEAPLPLLITVTGSAAPCRPCNAKRVMKYKRATAPIERTADMPYADEYDKKPYLT
ncbi:MAG: electron transfer flavoprotein subunit beta/FixA family protein, partial [Bacteroidaceae bacterium]|nr:electron transfer flavoprotein subunit beta/FixA family protein [Bacteroidaceae bacterium]